MNEEKTSAMTKLPGKLADHRTPLIFNEWYVVAFSEQIDRTLLSRKVLGIHLVLYRTEAGAVVAMHGRCPHRSFPLSHGKLEGDTVVCGYHGFGFGSDGNCSKIPVQASVPEAFRIRSFTVVEQAPLVWIWMGDPKRADPAAIPAHSWLSHLDYTHVSTYSFLKANYVRLHENVLDLTHFPFLHDDDLGSVAYARAPFIVRAEGDKVCITRVVENELVNPAHGRAIGNIGHRVRRSTESWFQSPAFHNSYVTIEDLEGGIDGRTDFHFIQCHIVTPETATTTHYFSATARDVNIHDDALSAMIKKKAVTVLAEDGEALEWIEESWRDEPEFYEFSIPSDRAGLMMRRIIARRAAAEEHGQMPALRP